MRKYEEKLHFDKYYNNMQSSGFLLKVIVLVWGITGYILLYCFMKFILAYIPDFQPWNDFKTWFNIGKVKFIKIDLAYFIYGFIITCYSTIRLSKITIQNHSAKDKKNSIPNKLLVEGYYGKVRHPMYGTFIIMQAGFLLSLRSFIGMILAFIVVIVQYINANLEEKKQLISIFGEEYYHYTKKVSRMLLTRSELIFLTIVLLFSVAGYLF